MLRNEPLMELFIGTKAQLSMVIRNNTNGNSRWSLVKTIKVFKKEVLLNSLFRNLKNNSSL
jgi:hypothetical protein